MLVTLGSVPSNEMYAMFQGSGRPRILTAPPEQFLTVTFVTAPAGEDLALDIVSFMLMDKFHSHMTANVPDPLAKVSLADVAENEVDSGLMWLLPAAEPVMSMSTSSIAAAPIAVLRTTLRPFTETVPRAVKNVHERRPARG